jgi:hypothetical protein
VSLPSSAIGYEGLHETFDLPSFDTIDGVTVLIGLYVREGRDAVLAADQRRGQLVLETGDVEPIKKENTLKSVRLNNHLAIACAGIRPFSTVIYGVLSRREDLIDFSEDHEITEILEKEPPEVGFEAREAVEAVTAAIGVAIDRVRQACEGWSMESLLSDASVILLGKEGGRPIFYRWEQKTGWQPHPRPFASGRMGVVAWPRLFTDADKTGFRRKLDRPQLPAAVRVRDAISFAASKSDRVGAAFTMRRLSRGLDLEQFAA